MGMRPHVLPPCKVIRDFHVNVRHAASIREPVDARHLTPNELDRLLVLKHFMKTRCLFPIFNLLNAV